MENNSLEQVKRLYTSWAGHAPEAVTELPPSGSYRRYFRIKGIKGSAIGAWNEDYKENLAFCTFTKHFAGKGLNVPALYAEDLDNNVYLLQDLGDTSLLHFLQDNNFEKEITPEVKTAYRKVIAQLPRFQILGNDGLDYSKCFPRQAFDKQSMMWDLNYFKYYFLKLARVPFNEQDLEDDYETLCNFLLSAPSDYFLYRDFQSRNIMLVNGEPYFIDYQGGRKGALQYDIASVLFESKTALPAWFREELLNYYIEVLSSMIQVDRKKFLQYYYGFVYIRLMQAMGAYGFRGLYEKKELFLQSIPPALVHLEWLHQHADIPLELPALRKVWEHLFRSDYIRQLAKKTQQLHVRINSFSYRRGIPLDDTHNGGGFVFDCRAVTNPGKLEEYKNLTGRDPQVQEFFQKEGSMKPFLDNTFALVEQSVEKYMKRGFTNLMVNFGCTGGQHRSVYSAEKLFFHLKQKYPDITLEIRHTELEKK